MKPRRLKGHEAAVTCCIASRARPGIIASSGEDGRICWFDLRCKDVLFTIDLGEQPVSSLCFKAGNEDIVYASSGTKVLCLDIHMVSSWKPLETYNYNKDEINQIAYSSKSNFLAAADDSGDVKIIDTSQQCLYKTLRAVHTSICSSVQFLSWKPWAAITGGLDSKLAMWDFSKGRPSNVIDYGMPEVDGTVSCESGLATMKSKNFSQSKNFQSRSKKSGIQAANQATGRNLGKRIQLDYSLGGHTAAVSCVSFSLFGERGKFLISGGNDACVKLWDWSRYFCAEQTSCNNDLILNIDVKKKVNWLCTTTADSENLVVCDTSKLLKIYTVL
uniref:WD repeat-containing protein 53 isoform X3 n=1 Tax=Elaeis guineensis var. tenera TaxID=51953 RepID=A0A8N4F8I4_ELAGV|nr:WD repeat-containing protein 53 isoform X3 [Elaeis guineensis]